MIRRKTTHGSVVGRNYVPDLRQATAPILNSVQVPCPECGAEVGEHCRKLDGSGDHEANRHRSRKRMAARKQNAELDHEGLLFAQKSSTDLRQRAVARRQVSSVARELGVDRSTLGGWLRGKRPTGKAGALFGRLLMRFIKEGEIYPVVIHSKTPLKELDGE